MADPTASAPPPVAAPYPEQQQQAYPQQQQPQQGVAAYPQAPQQQPYPPTAMAPGQQQQYPPPQAAYPPQQAQVAAGPYAGQPQQAVYPPQSQPGYPAPGPAYVQQGAAPPPYYPEQQHQQEVTTKVEIVQQQPTAMYVQPQRRYGSGDHGLVYAIIATLAVLFCCLYFPLICTIPAIFLAISAQDAASRGNDETSRSQTRASIILTSVGIGSIVAFWLVIVILNVTSGSSSS